MGGLIPGQAACTPDGCRGTDALKVDCFLGEQTRVPERDAMTAGLSEGGDRAAQGPLAPLLAYWKRSRNLTSSKPPGRPSPWNWENSFTSILQIGNAVKGSAASTFRGWFENLR